MSDAIQQFRDAIQSVGLIPPAVIEADGKLRRFASNGKRSDDAGWYVLHGGEIPAGAFGDWRTGINETWRTDAGRSLTPAEQEAHRARMEAMRLEREADDARRHTEAAGKAVAILQETTLAGDDHAYLTRKGIKGHGARLHKGTLVIPLRDGSNLHSLQFIAPDGDKRFLTGGRVAGCYYGIGETKGAAALCIAEGFATGATIHEATGYPVACAMTAGNLESVARTLRAKLPDMVLILCADDDAETEGNPGLTKATDAARAVGGLLAVPDFGTDRPEKATDFNDQAQLHGTDSVRQTILSAAKAAMSNGTSSESDVTPEADGAALLDDARAFIARFVAFPSPVFLDAVTLWAAHAHMVEHFHTSPRLAALSPEPESGKTRVLEILDLLTPSAMLIFSPSVAAIFRKLAQGQVTLLFDEVDTVFTSRGKDDQNEDLRALLNAGYRRGASIPRCVGPRHDVQDFRVFAAVALAGIGDLPDTITTRSIVIPMKRRAANEHIEQFRVRLHETEGHDLRDRLAQWAETVGPGAGSAWPLLPAGVADRRAEAWEPLIAVADAAGGAWPDRARVAAVADVAAHRERAPTLGIRLLADLRLMFQERESIATDEILKILNGMDESPWGDLRGKPLDSRGLAARLKKYGVKSKTIRVGESTPKGYARADLFDVFSRYLPNPTPSHPPTAATSATNATDAKSVEVEI